MRQLSSVSDTDLQVDYTYDDSGIRTGKTVNGVTTHYNTKDGVILAQSDGNNTLYFQYDTSGVPFAFVWNGTQYVYITNQMGDVIGITDDSGNLLVQYRYDAWGKLLSATLTDANNATQKQLAQLNPLLYRGYYYDFETGYYYLQSRYYDPNLCRFINSDKLEMELIFKSISPKNNSYCYCCNNPVNYTDKTGYVAIVDDVAFWGTLLGILEGLIIGIGTALWAIFIGMLIDIIATAVHSSPRTKYFPDTKAKEQKGKPYKVAYVHTLTNQLIKIGKKLSFVEALRALGIMAKTNSIKSRYNFKYSASKVSSDVKKASNDQQNDWGMYADSQSAAKALATVLGGTGKPEAHRVIGIFGVYRHYHDKEHNIHIWYGSPYYF